MFERYLMRERSPRKDAHYLFRVVPRKGATDMSTPNITRWIGIGLLGLPLYGILTFFSSIDPQPDPNTHYEAWSRFVTSDGYVLKHLFLTILGTIFGIFG